MGRRTPTAPSGSRWVTPGKKHDKVSTWEVLFKQDTSLFQIIFSDPTVKKKKQLATSEWLGIAPGTNFPTGKRKCSPLGYPQKETLKSSFSGSDQGNIVLLNRGVKIVAFLSTQGRLEKIISGRECFSHSIWASAEGSYSSNRALNEQIAIAGSLAMF